MYPSSSDRPEPDLELVSKHQGSASHSLARAFLNSRTFLHME